MPHPLFKEFYSLYNEHGQNTQNVAPVLQFSAMTDAERMNELFEGSDMAHGRSEMTQQITSKGKHEAKSWMEKRPATLDDWTKHLAGEAGLGMPPLNSKSLVRWGAIDVDIYNGLSIEELNVRIQQAHLPLVVCRSKSGGPHIYLFVQEWMPAKDMLEKLDSIAGFLGFGTCEVFPKQAMISVDEKNPDFGSWINMPYFAGTKFLRYGLDETGKALTTIEEFYGYCQSRRLTLQQFKSLEAPTPSEIFPDGPPCLNQIFASRPTDNRNILLSNAAVYCKKAYGEEWKTELDKINRLFPEPLGSGEVEAIKRSYDRKEYRYQCPKSPLCNFCDSSKCRKTKHGVGGGEFLPETRSLTMVNASPPIWYLDIALPDNKVTRISLSTEELQNPRLFQRRCMETVQRMPSSMKMEQWEPIVARLMQHCTRIELPPEMSPAGQFRELFWEFLQSRASEESIEDLFRGLPFRNEDGFSFRLRDLLGFLTNQKFTVLRQNEMFSLMKDLGTTPREQRIRGKHIRYLHTPNPNDTGTNRPESLQPADFGPAY